MLRFAIACGPTGGHLIPAKLVAEQLIEKGHQVQIFSSASPDNPLISEIKSRYYRLDTEGWQGGLFSRLRCLFKIGLEFKRSFKFLADKDAVISFGGYPALPLLLAARVRRSPIFIQEQNRLMGRANRLFASKARCCFWGFPPLQKSAASKNIVTGNPVRRQPPRRGNWFSKSPLLVVTGGSQGAKEISRYLTSSAPYFLSEGWHIFYVKGKFGLDVEYSLGSDPGLRQVEFEPELPSVIGASDCVWSRAGAGALSEIVYYGKPALLFPFPSAAENHQLLNARYIIENGPAEIGTELDPVRRFERSQTLAELKERYEFRVSSPEFPEEIIAEKVIEGVQINEKD